MIRTLFAAALSVAALTLSPAGASAHHSFSMFDQTREVTIRGRVTEFQWTNPHTFVEIDVPGANGRVVHWSIEGHSPNILARIGWRRNSLNAGDQVTLIINPLKDGRPGGALVTAILPDGTRLSQSSGRNR